MISSIDGQHDVMTLLSGRHNIASSITVTDICILQVFPSGRSSRSMGPGVEMRTDPGETRRRERELEEMTALE